MVIPMEARWSKRLVLEMVSKAAVRSRRMSIVQKPESAANRK